MNDKTENKYNTELCNNKMTFEECEIAVLRHAIDKNDKNIKSQFIQTQDIKRMVGVIEKFLIKRKSICYGGNAINAILPKHNQIYDKTYDAPDYDFFVIDGLQSAIELANDFFEAGYTEVEAKSGVHKLTYKIFVNFIPIADVTQLNKDIFYNLWKESITIGGIHYSSPNYLRMGIYLELSRPEGNIDRWEKLYKRLSLLNKYHPIKLLSVCKTIDFYTNLEETPSINPSYEGRANSHIQKRQHIEYDYDKPKISHIIPERYVDDKLKPSTSSFSPIEDMKTKTLYVIIRDTLIDEEVVFFGGYASLLYQRYIIHTKNKQTTVSDKKSSKSEHKSSKNIVLPSNIDVMNVLSESKVKTKLKSGGSYVVEDGTDIIVKKFGNLNNVPDFDVLSDTPEKTALVLREQLHASGFHHIHEIIHEPIDSIIPICYEIKVGDKSVANIFGTVGCHNYNKITIRSREIKVATIDTIMSFYLAFYYTNRFHHIQERILCFAKFLFDLEHHNRLNQTGLLKRFSMECIGKQDTLQSIRSEKNSKYEELKNKKETKEYQELFFMYRPQDNPTMLKRLENMHHNKSDETHKVTTSIYQPKIHRDFPRHYIQSKYKKNTKKMKFGRQKVYPYFKSPSNRKTYRRETNPKKAYATKNKYKRDPLVKQLFGNT